MQQRAALHHGMTQFGHVLFAIARRGTCTKLVILVEAHYHGDPTEKGSTRRHVRGVRLGVMYWKMIGAH